MRDVGAVGGRGRVEFSSAMVAGRAGSGAGRAWLRALAAAGPWLRCLKGRRRALGSSRAGAHGPGGSGSSHSSPVPARPARRGAVAGRSRAGGAGRFHRLAASLLVAIAPSVPGGRPLRVPIMALALAAWLGLVTSIAPPAQAQSQALVSNVGQTTDPGLNVIGYIQDLAQQFRTGDNAGGYTVSSIEVRLKVDRAGNYSFPTVRLSEGSVNGSTATLSTPLATLRSPSGTFSGGSNNYTYTLASPLRLKSDTDYWVLAEGGSSAVSWATTTSGSEDSGKASGWSIGDGLHVRAPTSSGTLRLNGSYVNQMRVNGTIDAVSAPEAPTRLTATGLETGVTLSWTAPYHNGGAAITGYRIEVSTDGTAFIDRVTDTSSPNTSYTHAGLTPGQTRYYRVSAINPQGTGSPSQFADATTGVCDPPDLSGRDMVWQSSLIAGRHTVSGSSGGPDDLAGYGWYLRTGTLPMRNTPIVIGTNRYRIGEMVMLFAQSGGLVDLLVSPPGALVFHLLGATDDEAELTASEKAGLVLHVCNTEFAFANATRPGAGPVVRQPGEFRHYEWKNAGLIWAADLERTLIAPG